MEFKQMLMNEGFDSERASHLSEVYEHGRIIIRVHRGSVPDGADDLWVNVGKTKEVDDE